MQNIKKNVIDATNKKTNKVFFFHKASTKRKETRIFGILFNLDQNEIYNSQCRLNL